MKNKEKVCGIYKLTSPTNRVYIGQSIDINRREKYYIDLVCNSQPKLCRSLNKYGFELHTFEIIEECLFNDLDCRERYWQDFYDVLNGGLNCKLTVCGDKKQMYSDDTRKKISESKLGKPLSEKNRKGISESLKEYYVINKHPAKGLKRGTINNKLVASQVLRIRELLLQKKTTLEIAKMFAVSKSTVQQIKSGKTWQLLGEFKVEGKVSRLKEEDLQVLYKLFEIKLKVKDIQKVLPYCVSTIAKQRKIWNQMKKDLH